MPAHGSAGAAAAAHKKSGGVNLSSGMQAAVPELQYDGMRQVMHHFVESQRFRYFIAFVILSNTCMVVYETNSTAFCDKEPEDAYCSEKDAVIIAVNLLFLAVYAVEMVLRLFVYRLQYLLSWGDRFDGCVVVAGILSESLGSAFPGIGILRLFRVFRVIKTMKQTAVLEEVQVFISGVASTAKAICVGCVIIFIVTFLWAIVVVVLLNPINQDLVRAGAYEGDCDRCPRAYDSVQQAMLTLLQTVVMGDEWGQYTMPIIDQAPWTVLLFITIQFSICLGLTNLILAVIMDKALSSRDVNLNREATERADALDKARRDFVNICQIIDADKSGFLTLTELKDGYQHETFRNVLTLMDINTEDLATVFKMMDRDKSGTVSYEEFSYQLQTLKTQDIHTMVYFIKFYVLDLHSLHEEHVRHLQMEGSWKRGAGDLAQEVEEKASAPVAVTAVDRAAELDVALAGVAISPLERAPLEDRAGGADGMRPSDESWRRLMQELGRRSDAHAAMLRESLDISSDRAAQVLAGALGRQVDELRARLDHQVASMREAVTRDLELSVKIFRAYLSESRELLAKAGVAGSSRPARLCAEGAALPAAATPSGCSGDATPPVEEDEEFGGNGVMEPRLTVQGPGMLRAPGHDTL